MLGLGGFDAILDKIIERLEVVRLYLQHGIIDYSIDMPPYMPAELDVFLFIRYFHADHLEHGNDGIFFSLPTPEQP
jgi:hypothetical protein